jgi:uncharacterized protein
MKSQRTKNGYLIKVDPSEDIVTKLLSFAREQNIRGASFTMIGAVSRVELGYYVLAEKKYYWKVFEGTIEIVSGTGNIAWMGSEPVIHLHGVFSGTDFATFGGHVRSATVSAACEIVLHLHEEGIVRAGDEYTGLNLWKLD